MDLRILNGARKILRDRIKLEIGDFTMDNINEKDGTNVWVFFKKALIPIGLTCRWRI